MDYSNHEILIKGLKKGEEKAYEFLIDTFYRKLLAYSISLINDKAMAEDIVQNVLMKTWQYRKKLDHNHSIQGFLYKSVYNEFVNVYQKSRSTTLLHYKYLEGLEDIALQTNEKQIEHFITIVTEEIQKLPPKCRKVFTLSKLEGLTNHEISDHLEISVKTVEAQITKAYTHLRKRLGRQYKTILLLFFPEKTRSLL